MRQSTRGEWCGLEHQTYLLVWNTTRDYLSVEANVDSYWEIFIIMNKIHLYVKMGHMNHEIFIALMSQEHRGTNSTRYGQSGEH